ncbi:MAG: hypothetical protein KKG59_00490 [Nanoarchaeota archaeon]|nr:hypothetical protein [Nanoarchaeota archaeon]
MITDEMLAGARAVARRHYTDLFYHNWGHVIATEKFALQLVERCAHYEIVADRNMVSVAALFHDAGYYEKNKKRGYDTKEKYSASIAHEELWRLRFPSVFIQNVIGCIIATEASARPKFVEQKILRAADLHQLAGEYEQFKHNNQMFKQEYELMNNCSLTDPQWLEITLNLLQQYLDEDIRLTPEHDDPAGVSEFHKLAYANLARYAQEFGSK